MKSGKPEQKPHWTERWKLSIPDRQALANSRWLKPVAHHVLDPRLWHLQHEAVARGAAIGIFWAFCLPVAQILVAVLHSVWWRANIPVAVGATLITNPFTLGFWLWLAYQTGGFFMDAPPPEPFARGDSIMDWAASFGGPTLMGMGIFAVAGSVSAYVAVKQGWRLRIWLRLHSRRARQSHPFRKSRK